MSDELFNNDYNPEQNPVQDHTVMNENAEPTGQAETKRSYEDVYSSSSSYRQPSDDLYTNPYMRMSRQPQTDYHSGVNSTYSDPSQEPITPKNDYYNDGYYHKSFSGDTSGTNINYTAPRYTQTPQRAASGYTQPPIQETYNSNRKSDHSKSSGISKGGIALLLVVCMLISAAAGFGGSMIASQINKSQYDTDTSNTMIIHKVNVDDQQAGTEALVNKTTAEITSEVADTVVEITTEVMQTSSFYGQYIAKGAGSGVIISEDGYIITNNHVIDGASSIKVTTRSGDSYDAKLIGTDAEVDIAVLKIEATGLPTAVFGDSDKLEVGDKSVIIGNPLGTLGGSVTEGIISALDRSIVIDGKTMHLMQTDAAINPGNSGGGMFNGQGELAGIVVAKSSSEGIDNIGFVIPINNVLDILGDLKDYGYVRGRADTGMSFIDLSNQMYAWYYYGNSSAGVYISSVEADSNAYKAGFRQGDRVISVDGKEISKSADIDEILKEKSVGDKVTFELERSGSKGSLELELQEYVPAASKSTSQESDSDNSRGIDPFDMFR